MLKNRSFAFNNQVVFTITFLLGLILFSICGYYMRFQVAHNDFWGVLYYGKHLSFSEPASLYNGFFAFALSIALASLFVGWLSNLFFLIKKSVWGLVAILVAAISYPLFFHYANTTSPDIGAAALSMGGIYFLWKHEFQVERSLHQVRDDILSGLLFGFSALFRSHGIVSAAAILLAYTIMLGLRAIWQRKAIPITLALVYMIQVGANLLSGHGALENGQNFTAYITFHGMMNWWHIPPDVYSFSVVNQFFKDPIGFIELFIPLFLALIIYALPALLGLFVFKNSLEKKFAWFVLIATFVYSALVAIGTSASDRGPFPILGMAFICSGLLGIELWTRAKTLLAFSKLGQTTILVILALATGWLASSWFSTDRDFLDLYRGQSENFRVIEAKLVAKGMKNPAEVFTNKFVLYFPDMPPYRPFMNGGWEDYSLWNYRQEFPEMPTDSWDAFIKTCSANKIRFLVLSPGTEMVAGFLDELYSGDFKPAGVELIANVGKTKIFQIKP
jgi:hypothetical protein